MKIKMFIMFLSVTCITFPQSGGGGLVKSGLESVESNRGSVAQTWIADFTDVITEIELLFESEKTLTAHDRNRIEAKIDKTERHVDAIERIHGHNLELTRNKANWLSSAKERQVVEFRKTVAACAKEQEILRQMSDKEQKLGSRGLSEQERKSLNMARKKVREYQQIISRQRAELIAGQFTIANAVELDNENMLLIQELREILMIAKAKLSQSGMNNDGIGGEIAIVMEAMSKLRPRLKEIKGGLNDALRNRINGLENDNHELLQEIDEDFLYNLIDF
jgi:hypothetical protein